MRQFGDLCYFEVKKILQKKSFWITFIILTGFLIFMTISAYLGSTYVEGRFYQTRAEKIAIDHENGVKMSGEQIDDILLNNMQKAMASIVDKDKATYMWEENYQEEIRPYESLYYLTTCFLQGSELNPLSVTEEEFYRARKEQAELYWDSFNLTEKEKTYWNEKEEQLPQIFTYQYAEGFGNIANMSGGYMVCMVVTFFIAICMSQVLTEEHNHRTDQLILCTRYGRKKLYGAKLLVGSGICVIATGLMFLLVVICSFIIYGTEGYHALIQVAIPYTCWYSGDLTVGKIVWIIVGLLIIIAVLNGIFAMVISELLHNNIATMAIMIGGIFLARSVMVPYSSRILSQLWNYLPINLLKIDQGMLDERLVSILGFNFTTWQFAPILYVIFIVALILIGKRVYCHYQVAGR